MSDECFPIQFLQPNKRSITLSGRTLYIQTLGSMDTDMDMSTTQWHGKFWKTRKGVPLGYAYKWIIHIYKTKQNQLVIMLKYEWRRFKFQKSVKLKLSVPLLNVITWKAHKTKKVKRKNTKSSRRSSGQQEIKIKRRRSEEPEERTKCRREIDLRIWAAGAT